MTPKRRRILLLDDDRELLQLLVAYLKGPLVDLVVCSEIEAAECLLDREHFDVLVTDLELSALGGLEGIRLVRHVTCNFPNTDVVVFSGYINDEVRELGRALGVLELLDKPHGLFRLRKILGGESRPDEGLSDREPGSVRQVETLESVLSSRCITAVLQPIVALAPVEPGEWLHGVEGLSRGPEGSPLRSPDVFLDLASRKERLFETELQCFEAVLVEGRSLPGSHGLFLNTRPRSMSMPDFSAQLCELVHRYGYKPCDIVLELTEQQSVLNSEAFEATLGALRTRGFRLALDDYGSGFANLDLVQRLNLDYLKIDGRFCQEIQRSSSKQAIVGSTAEMAGKLGILTIMERVETHEELETIRTLGVDFAQGYYFSRPRSGSELASEFLPKIQDNCEVGCELPNGMPDFSFPVN